MEESLITKCYTFGRLNRLDPWIWFAVCCGNFVKILEFWRLFLFRTFKEILETCSPPAPSPTSGSGALDPGQKGVGKWMSSSRIFFKYFDIYQKIFFASLLIGHIRYCSEKAKTGTFSKRAVIFIIFNTYDIRWNAVLIWILDWSFDFHFC